MRPRSSQRVPGQCHDETPMSTVIVQHMLPLLAGRRSAMWPLQVPRNCYSLCRKNNVDDQVAADPQEGWVSAAPSREVLILMGSVACGSQALQRFSAGCTADAILRDALGSTVGHTKLGPLAQTRGLRLRLRQSKRGSPRFAGCVCVSSRFHCEAHGPSWVWRQRVRGVHAKFATSSWGQAFRGQAQIVFRRRQPQGGNAIHAPRSACKR